MSKTRRFIKKNKKQKRKSKTFSKKYIGGVGSSIGFPPCTIVSTFPISNTQITQFKRDVIVGMDCFISALQIFGILNSDCSNILRMSSAGTTTGFNKKQMENIFIYIYRNNYCFKEFESDQYKFVFNIINSIAQENAIFVGYERMVGPRPFGHVFIIAKSKTGVYIIDPQIIPQNIDLLDVKYLIKPGITKYYILYNSITVLNERQIEYVKEISSGANPDAAKHKYRAQGATIPIPPNQTQTIPMPPGQGAAVPIPPIPPGQGAAVPIPPIPPGQGAAVPIPPGQGAAVPMETEQDP